MRRIQRPQRPLPDVRLEPQSALRSRKLRSPSHSFRVKLRPWQIVPTLFAPVIAGDSVKGYSLQSRTLSDPIHDKLAGWWLEHYLFYVKVGDFEDTLAASMRTMMIEGNTFGTNNSGYEFYQNGAVGVPDFIAPAYNRIVEAYFRNDPPFGTTYNTYQIGNYAACKLNRNSWWDSVTKDEDLDDPIAAGDPEEWDEQFKAYQSMRSAKLTTATWAEYLMMQGVQAGPQLIGEEKVARRPELLRFVRDFQYPVQAVEPSTGVPSALVQWSVADRMTRGKQITEPGFLLGLAIARPKAFMKNQRANATEFLMNRPAAWMPIALESDPHARLRMFDGVGTVGGAGNGPIHGAYDDYWLDPGDLLNNGDQFTNYDLGSTVAGALTGINTVALPVATNTTFNPAFPSATDADGVFSGANKALYCDGIYTLRIASRSGGVDATGRKGYW